jgi:hypothetical protein
MRYFDPSTSTSEIVVYELTRCDVGKIMKLGNTFACFMTKKIVFSQVLQLLAYKSIFFI